MKVEKINNNKVKIILTFEELEKRQINIKDIEKNTEIAKNLFVDLIEESNTYYETDNQDILQAREMFRNLENKYDEQIKDEKKKVIEAGIFLF